MAALSTVPAAAIGFLILSLLLASVVTSLRTGGSSVALLVLRRFGLPGTLPLQVRLISVGWSLDAPSRAPPALFARWPSASQCHCRPGHFPAGHFRQASQIAFLENPRRI